MIARADRYNGSTPAPPIRIQSRRVHDALAEPRDRPAVVELDRRGPPHAHRLVVDDHERVVLVQDVAVLDDGGEIEELDGPEAGMRRQALHGAPLERDVRRAGRPGDRTVRERRDVRDLGDDERGPVDQVLRRPVLDGPADRGSLGMLRVHLQDASAPVGRGAAMVLGHRHDLAPRPDVPLVPELEHRHRRGLLDPSDVRLEVRDVALARVEHEQLTADLADLLHQRADARGDRRPALPGRDDDGQGDGDV